jgi:hypothetical protein
LEGCSYKEIAAITSISYRDCDVLVVAGPASIALRAGKKR